MTRAEIKIGGETDAEWAAMQLGHFKQRFDPVLEAFLATEIEAATIIRPELTELLDVCTKFIMGGGKRLRPAFVYFGYKAAGGMDEEIILRAAVPIELVHAGALVHDDVIDNSDLRRGKPTVHRVFEENLGSAETGRSTAIVAGDLILALADRTMSEYPYFDDRFRVARRFFDQMCVEINYGEHLDVIGNLMGLVDEDWVMKVMQFKTAGYTVEKPLLIGAALTGADQKVLETLSRYGTPLGIAFQIKDDILGMFGNEAEMGKPVDSDLREGKKTLLVIQTVSVLENNRRWTDRQRFMKILGNPDLTNDDYLWCQNLIRETGALTHCENQATELTSQAKQALLGTGLDQTAIKYLLGVADFLVERQY